MFSRLDDSPIDMGEGMQKEFGFCLDPRTDGGSGTKADLFPDVTRRLSEISSMCLMSRGNQKRANNIIEIGGGYNISLAKDEILLRY